MRQNTKSLSFFLLREIYKLFYEETVSSSGRAALLKAEDEDTASNPYCFFYFIHQKRKEKVWRKQTLFKRPFTDRQHI